MLPGIDDGSKNLSQSLAMARLALDDGVSGIAVMTPHHLNGVYNNRSASILSALTAFREAPLIAEGIGPEKILPGSELHLVSRNCRMNWLPGHALTLANKGKAVLIELPVHTVPMGSEHLLGADSGPGTATRDCPSRAQQPVAPASGNSSKSGSKWAALARSPPSPLYRPSSDQRFERRRG